MELAYGRPVPLELPAALQHSYKQMAPFLRSHRPQLSWRRSPACHCCRDTQASSGLEKARRETQLHLVTFGGGRPEISEHWFFFSVEKSFWAGGLVPHRGHGYALEECAIRRRRSVSVLCLQMHYRNKLSFLSTTPGQVIFHPASFSRSCQCYQLSVLCNVTQCHKIFFLLVVICAVVWRSLQGSLHERNRRSLPRWWKLMVLTRKTTRLPMMYLRILIHLLHSVSGHEGCLINKLQNSFILLVLEISKMQNIRFVGNFILNMCKEIFLMMVPLLWPQLFIEHILYVYYFLHQ